MTVGDLRRSIEDLPDNFSVVVCYGEKALHVGGLGIASMGLPATFADSPLGVIGGPSVFEITARDNA